MIWLRIAVILAMPYCWFPKYYAHHQSWPIVETEVCKIAVVCLYEDDIGRVVFIGKNALGVRVCLAWESFSLLGKMPTRLADGRWTIAYKDNTARCYRIVVAPEYEMAGAEYYAYKDCPGLPPPPPPSPFTLVPRDVFRGLAMTLAEKTSNPSELP